MLRDFLLQLVEGSAAQLYGLELSNQQAYLIDVELCHVAFSTFGPAMVKPRS